MGIEGGGQSWMKSLRRGIMWLSGVLLSRLAVDLRPPQYYEMTRRKLMQHAEIQLGVFASRIELWASFVSRPSISLMGRSHGCKDYTCDSITHQSSKYLQTSAIPIINAFALYEVLDDELRYKASVNILEWHAMQKSWNGLSGNSGVCLRTQNPKRSSLADLRICGYLPLGFFDVVDFLNIPKEIYTYLIQYHQFSNSLCLFSIFPFPPADITFYRASNSDKRLVF